MQTLADLFLAAPAFLVFHHDAGDGGTTLVPGCVIRARPIGVLIMEDEAGMDEKILSVPVDDLHPYYSEVTSYRGLPSILRDQIAHFFQHYKDLEPNKWVKIKRWGEAEEACRIIESCIESQALQG